MDELAKRIEARLHEVVEMRQAAGFEVTATHGLTGADGVVRMSLTDVARIAADEARGWF